MSTEQNLKELGWDVLDTRLIADAEFSNDGRNMTIQCSKELSPLVANDGA